MATLTQILLDAFQGGEDTGLGNILPDVNLPASIHEPAPGLTPYGEKPWTETPEYLQYLKEEKMKAEGFRGVEGDPLDLRQVAPESEWEHPLFPKTRRYGVTEEEERLHGSDYGLNNYIEYLDKQIFDYNWKNIPSVTEYFPTARDVVPIGESPTGETNRGFLEKINPFKWVSSVPGVDALRDQMAGLGIQRLIPRMGTLGLGLALAAYPTRMGRGDVAMPGSTYDPGELSEALREYRTNRLQEAAGAPGWGSKLADRLIRSAGANVAPLGETDVRYIPGGRIVDDQLILNPPEELTPVPTNEAYWDQIEREGSAAVEADRTATIEALYGGTTESGIGTEVPFILDQGYVDPYISTTALPWDTLGGPEVGEEPVTEERVEEIKKKPKETRTSVEEQVIVASEVQNALTNAAAGKPVQENLQAIVALSKIDPTIAKRYTTPGSQALQDITSQVESFADMPAVPQPKPTKPKGETIEQKKEAAAQKRRDKKAAAKREAADKRAADKAAAKSKAMSQAQKRNIARAAKASRAAEAAREAATKKAAEDQRRKDKEAQKIWDMHKKMQEQNKEQRAREAARRLAFGYGSGAMYT